MLDLKTMLIVDDQPMLRQQFIKANKELAQNLQFEIIQAHDGFDGIKQFISHHVDYLVVDVHMPVMNGLKMLEKLHLSQRDKLSETTIFMLTAEADHELRTLGKSYGVKSWIIKPISIEKFLDFCTKN
jgi:two-component system, chemotaxis family, chemotaxis protein CheY